MIMATAAGAESRGACIVGIPAFDTLKRVDAAGCIEETVKRDTIWMAQTPQAFRYELIRAAHEAARATGYLGTDDASLVERMGSPVKIILGSRTNLKITTPEDLAMARALRLIT
jgi:2-C-methyl-D-erythritol 4-phosphate cytidylyltransferase